MNDLVRMSIFTLTNRHQVLEFVLLAKVRGPAVHTGDLPWRMANTG
jgi:hypothetical protein